MTAQGNITITGTASGNGKFNSNAQGGGGGGGDIAGYHTITGTGLGTNSTLGYSDDFESRIAGAIGTAGQTGLTIGSLIINGDCAGTAITTTNPYSGTKALKQTFGTTDFPEIYYPLSLTDYVYLSCHFRIDGAGPTVYKFSRFGANVDGGGGGGVYHGTPHGGFSYTASSGSAVPGSFSGEIKSQNPEQFTSYSANNTATQDPATAFKNGSYVFYEGYCYVGTVNGNNAFFLEKADNKTTCSWINVEFLTTSNSTKLQWALTPLNGFDNPATATATIDNLYISTNLYRVVMTDNATYGSSTVFMVQPFVGVSATWTPTLVRPKKLRGPFSIGATAYLHTFANNTLVKSETITVTADNA